MSESSGHRLAAFVGQASTIPKTTLEVRVEDFCIEDILCDALDWFGITQVEFFVIVGIFVFLAWPVLVTCARREGREQNGDSGGGGLRNLDGGFGDGGFDCGGGDGGGGGD